MMSPMYVGQQLPSMLCTIMDDRGNVPINFSTATWTLSMHNLTTGILRTGTGIVVITDAAHGVLRYDWDTLDVAVAGTFRVQLVGTFPTGGQPLISDPKILLIKPL